MSGFRDSWTMWNPWHGCHKLSPGCRLCYVYRGDERRGKDSSIVTKTKNFDLLVRKKHNGDYKIPSGSLIAACFTSDFFLEDADEWRIEAWSMIRERSDLYFFMITKRIDRFYINLPTDWGNGYPNVTIACTVENQNRADYRLPLLNAAPIHRKMIICEPILEEINLEPHLNNSILQVVVGGESGNNSTPCNYNWVLTIRNLCANSNISFWFKQTGASFIKNNRLYHIKRQLQHAQARKAGININVKKY